MTHSYGNLEQESTQKGEAKRAYVYSGYSPDNHYTSYDVYRVYSPPDATGSVGLKVYNTGKVLIGAAYQPRPRYDLSEDAERLQEALLDSKEARDARTEALFMRWLYGIGLIGLIVIIATR